MVTMEHEQYKPTVSKAHVEILNLNNFKVMEAMGIKIITSRFPCMTLSLSVFLVVVNVSVVGRCLETVATNGLIVHPAIIQSDPKVTQPINQLLEKISQLC
jgi:hypothetical protein